MLFRSKPKSSCVKFIQTIIVSNPLIKFLNQRQSQETDLWLRDYTIFRGFVPSKFFFFFFLVGTINQCFNLSCLLGRGPRGNENGTFWVKGSKSTYKNTIYGTLQCLYPFNSRTLVLFF